MCGCGWVGKWVCVCAVWCGFGDECVVCVFVAGWVCVWVCVGGVGCGCEWVGECVSE